MKYESGFEWRRMEPTDGREGPRLDLFAPDGNVAASVFLKRDHHGHNWFVWDENGTGGENSVESSIPQAKIAAESAVLRWGKHFEAKRTKADDQPTPIKNWYESRGLKVPPDAGK